MLLFLTPLFIALAATIFGIYYAQRNLSAKTEDIKIAALANKLYRAAGIHVYYMYAAIVLSGILVSAFLYGVFSFPPSAIVGFFLGLFSTMGVGHFALFFLMKLNARLADRSARGLIDAFHAVFEGGNALGVFIAGSVLLVVSVFYSSADPSIEGLVSVALGSVLAAMFIKIGADFYAKAILENKDIFRNLANENETRDPETIAQLTSHNLRYGIGALIGVFETTLLSILGVMLMAIFALPGFTNALILPFIIVGVGLISTTINGKLIKTGATVNIVKNILFTILSSVALASLISFSIVLWLTNKGFQYSSIATWLTVFLGFVSAGFVAIFHYFYNIKRFTVGVGSALMVFVFMFGLFASYLLTGLYGIALYVLSIIALAPLYVALSIFGSVSDSVNRIVDIADLPEERKKIIQKLNSISEILQGGAATYFFVSALFSALVYFYLYQQDIVANFSEIEFSFTNPIIFIGMFFGGIGLYATIAGMLFAQKRMNFALKNMPSWIKRGDRKDHHVIIIKKLANYIVRAITLPVFLIFIFPLVAASILRVEGFAGFIAGELLLGGFWGFMILLQRHEGVSSEGRYGAGLSSHGDSVTILIASALKATTVFSLLLIILFI